MLTKRGKNGIVEHGGGASGAMAPPLGHLKAPVNTGADRPAGQARIQRRNVTEDTVMVLHSAFGLYQTGIFQTIQRDVHSAGWSCGPHRR